jgi:hypothetical protein
MVGAAFVAGRVGEGPADTGWHSNSAASKGRAMTVPLPRRACPAGGPRGHQPELTNTWLKTHLSGDVKGY